MTAQAVKDEFLKIWPLGTKCEHTHAREGFRLLDEMIAEEQQMAKDRAWFGELIDQELSNPEFLREVAEKFKKLKDMGWPDNELTPEFIRDQSSRRG